MNFKEFLVAQETAVQNLQANVGETIKNQILQILSQPQYAQQKAAWDRLQANPQLYQAFMSDVATESGGTYNLPPAKYLQLITKHSLRAAGTYLPPQIQQPYVQPQMGVQQ